MVHEGKEEFDVKQRFFFFYVLKLETKEELDKRREDEKTRERVRKKEPDIDR